MDADAPDPKSLTVWEEAFRFPIISVRRMEQQLHNDIGSNREKLRSLVGYGLSLVENRAHVMTDELYSTTYRDLLGTADSIIEMDGQMQQVENLLGDIGMRCNFRLLDRVSTNFATWGYQSKTIGVAFQKCSRPTERGRHAKSKHGRKRTIHFCISAGGTSQLP